MASCCVRVFWELLALNAAAAAAEVDAFSPIDDVAVVVVVLVVVLLPSPSEVNGTRTCTSSCSHSISSSELVSAVAVAVAVAVVVFVFVFFCHSALRFESMVLSSDFASVFRYKEE